MSPERGNAGTAPESIFMFIIRKAIDWEAVGLVFIAFSGSERWF